MRGVVQLWALSLAAVIAVVWLPGQRTSSAVSYVHDGWLDVTDYKRKLTRQVVRPGPHHLAGMFSDGISGYIWFPDGDAALYRFSSISQNTRQTHLLLRCRNGGERLLADTAIDGDYHRLPESAEVVRVRRHSVATIDIWMPMRRRSTSLSPPTASERLLTDWNNTWSAC